MLIRKIMKGVVLPPPLVRTGLYLLLMWTHGAARRSPSAVGASQPSTSQGANAQRQHLDRGLKARASGETLIFDENFDDLNHDLWKHEITMGGGGNWEFQMYGNNRTNSYVENGKLFLQPTLTSDFLGEDQVKGVSPVTYEIWGIVPADQCTSNMFWGCSRSSDAGRRLPINPVMSAKVMTAGKFSFRYGRVEVKAKLPKGDWLWPAIWLLPEHDAYGQWPASGEIDVMESRGNAPSYGKGHPDIGGVESFSSAAHWGPHYRMDSWDMTYGVTRLDKGATFNDDFHVFGLYWDETQMYTYLDTDDNRVLSVDFGVGTESEGLWEKGRFAERYPGVQNPWKGGAASAPFDQRFYLAINVAVGGVSGFFPDGVGGKMWQNGDSDAAMKFLEAVPQWFDTWDGKGSALQVEHVRVWQTNPDYLFSPAAATSTAAAPAASGGGGNPSADAETPMPEDWSADMAAAGGEGSTSGGSWQWLGFLSCALVGALVGGFAVGTMLQRQNNYRWSEVYARIDSPGERPLDFSQALD